MKLFTKRNLTQYFGGLILTFLFFAVQVFSQTDGKIVEREEYTFSTAFVGEITKTKPAEKPIFENTKIKKITYLSDNLKIKGFVAMPKKAGKFPVIIYNRGGNREFGQLNEF